MSPGRADDSLIRRHLAALDRALVELRKHTGGSLDQLRASVAETWLVERGLQLCAQNALDIATHVAAAAGLDAPDYATAIDRMAELGVLDATFPATAQPVVKVKLTLDTKRTPGWNAIDAVALLGGP